MRSDKTWWIFIILLMDSTPCIPSGQQSFKKNPFTHEIKAYWMKTLSITPSIITLNQSNTSTEDGAAGPPL